MSALRAIVVGLALASPTVVVACASQPASQPVRTTLPVCAPDHESDNVVTIDDRANGGYATCDIVPPMRADLIVHADSVAQAQSVCDDAGGVDLTDSEVKAYSDPSFAIVLRCESVDY